jgi:hypothetical protein
VQLLYERAVAAFPLTSQLWLQYVRYLEAEVKVPDVINKVCACVCVCVCDQQQQRTEAHG